jgi:hypothetical protein
MDERTPDMVAACGLDCGVCDIRLVRTDPGSARRIVAWFRLMGWLQPEEGLDELVARDMYCHGCRGRRDVHWSPNCWILRCCVDDKQLASCAECGSFPCRRLRAWAQETERHQQALARLRRRWLAAHPTAQRPVDAS